MNLNPFDWIRTKAQMWALMGLALVLFITTASAGLSLLGEKSEHRRTQASLTATAGERDEANRKLGSCEVQAMNLQTSLNEQNAYVKKLQADGEAAERAGREALAAAQAEARRQRSRAESILQARPADPTNLCASARELIVDTLSKERAQ